MVRRRLSPEPRGQLDRLLTNMRHYAPRGAALRCRRWLRVYFCIRHSPLEVETIEINGGPRTDGGRSLTAM
jgi:hypothetical protein